MGLHKPMHAELLEVGEITFTKLQSKVPYFQATNPTKKMGANFEVMRPINLRAVKPQFVSDGQNLELL
jgi:hypothetical protein